MIRHPDAGGRGRGGRGRPGPHLRCIFRR